MGMKKKYQLFYSKKYQGVFDGLKDCLLEVKSYAKGIGGLVFKLTVFVDIENEEVFRQSVVEFSRTISDCFQDEVPSFNIVSQKPFASCPLIIEAGFVIRDGLLIRYKMIHGFPYVLIEDETVKELWVSGNGGNCCSTNIEQDSIRAFEQVVEILHTEGMTIDDIIRQWNYVGEILKVNGSDGRNLQNYQVFNEVRGRFYRQHRTRKDFPSATGIGVKTPGVTIDFFAVQLLGDSVATSAVINRKQQNPYVYGQEVLIGSAPVKKAAKQPPQFERARLLRMPGSATLFLSGTASIIGQETVGIGDVEEQTRVTIANLEELSRSVEESQKTDAWRYSLLRVYVKNEEDFSLVESICKAHFPDIPISFVQADVCRDNLLVEIEGEMGVNN
ncbi:dioxygenase [Marinilabilia sp.]|uniref:chorismate transformation enzyme, FkbO/Hyg5 family n=1 Tax=Marinilabilia sp. TaxID=2021252 RepID=UPI0025C4A637|nr:dioxygenase [Marinilabilia sp.]